MARLRSLVERELRERFAELAWLAYSEAQLDATHDRATLRATVDERLGAVDVDDRTRALGVAFELAGVPAPD